MTWVGKLSFPCNRRTSEDEDNFFQKATLYYRPYRSGKTRRTRAGFPGQSDKPKRQPPSAPSGSCHLLSDLLLGAVSPGVVDAFGEVLDEADPLRYPDLLLLRQLRRQPRLAGGRVINRNRDLLLKLKYCH